MATNLFEKNLTASNGEIKKARAKNLGEDAKNAQTVLIISLKDTRRDIQRQIMDLEDLSPDTAMSLNPVKGNFDAKEWVRKLHESAIELKQVNEELEIAINMFNKYFSTGANDKMKLEDDSTEA
jgi:hypothetical protein